MPFPIVGMGASAGGLEAVSELLGGLPSTTGMAFLLVQHLDPGHESMLAEILAKKTAMPVREVEEGMAVEPNRLYVIPPNTTMAIARGVLTLQSRKATLGKHMPIDFLFHSLAQDQGPNAIGVVLSGSGSDGALGLQEIKGEGGITFAQDEGSARFSNMPRAAIGLGCVDFILSPSEIAQELTRITQHPYLNGFVPEASDDSAAASEPELKRVFRLLFAAAGIDFSHYKRSTVQRRLTRRMALHKLHALGDYLTLLESNPSEVQALGQDLLIRVTGFFRDPETFEGLAKTVFPQLLEGRLPGEPVRIWVPGCASGEEVYSIAICLLEYLGDRVINTPIQIFGSDVADAAIERARAGTYIENIAQEVSAERLQRFFVKVNEHYQIAKSIRDLCVFARQDLTRDPPFSRLDLVSCRNLLIYLDSVLQKRVIPLFHYALKPGGDLVLGPSETIGPFADLFHLLDKKLKIYTKKPLPGRPYLEFTEGPHAPRRAEAKGMVALAPEPSDTGRLQREADRVLLARYAPAGVLVDEALNILQFRGQTGRYLEPAPGPASLNLRKLVRPGLLVELTATLQQAKKDLGPARRPGLRLEIQGRVLAVDLEVIPVKVSPAESRWYLILFEDPPRLEQGQPGGFLTTRRAQPRGGGRAGRAAVQASEEAREVVRLKRELEATRDYIQTMIEEHEAGTEELKSAQEELLSSNEEFHSTNEELETAKEELQSANEELTTTNEELRTRNRQLIDLNEELRRARDALRESEARLTLAMEGAGMATWDVDLRTGKVLWSRRHFELLGYVPIPDGQATMEMWRSCIHPDDLERVLQAAERALREHSLYSPEYRIVRVDTGETVWFRESGRCLYDEAGQAVRFIGVFFDDTERKQAEEALKEANRHKDEFLAMLSHELRNPLAPLRNALQMLRTAGVDAATAQQQQDLMDRQVTKLTRLVEDLLDVSRITQGRIGIKKGPVDLASVVSSTVAIMRHHIDARGTQLSVSLPATPLWVEGDPIRLEQVITNLLNNAAKYSGEAGQIDLTIEGQDHEAVLKVADHGIGIAPELLPRIFELFVQADTSLARNHGGLGIGLTLVRAIVELHGGRVEAKSQGLGQGSEFSVRLPLLPEAHIPAAQPKSEPPEHPSAPAASRRVLVVDDDGDVADSVASLIRAWGHTVEVAHDGVSALQAARPFRPEVALLDIGLPAMTGLDLARRLRALPGLEQLFLVALTGYGRNTDRQAALDAGFHRHLVKPVEPQVLERLLASLDAPPTRA